MRSAGMTKYAEYFNQTGSYTMVGGNVPGAAIAINGIMDIAYGNVNSNIDYINIRKPQTLFKKARSLSMVVEAMVKTGRLYSWSVSPFLGFGMYLITGKNKTTNKNIKNVSDKSADTTYKSSLVAALNIGMQFNKFLFAALVGPSVNFAQNMKISSPDGEKSINKALLGYAYGAQIKYLVNDNITIGFLWLNSIFTHKQMMGHKYLQDNQIFNPQNDSMLFIRSRAAINNLAEFNAEMNRQDALRNKNRLVGTRVRVKTTTLALTVGVAV